MERLRSYSWPGNIRELQSTLKQALLQASGTVLLPGFLPEPLGGNTESDALSPLEKDLDLKSTIRQQLGPEARDLYGEMHRQLDRVLLPLVLEYTQGNQHQAARLLGIARQTLRLKLRELGLHITRAVEAEEDNQC